MLLKAIVLCLYASFSFASNSAIHHTSSKDKIQVPLAWANEEINDLQYKTLQKFCEDYKNFSQEYVTTIEFCRMLERMIEYPISLTITVTEYMDFFHFFGKQNNVIIDMYFQKQVKRIVFDDVSTLNPPSFNVLDGNLFSKTYLVDRKN